MSKVDSIFGARWRGKLGCGFLSTRDVEELLEDRLDSARRERFERHQRESCAECLHLVAAIEEFRRVLADGALTVEAESFSRTERSLKLRLREEFGRLFARRGTSLASVPWERELTAEELRWIAAAGPSAPDEEPQAERDPDEPADR